MDSFNTFFPVKHKTGRPVRRVGPPGSKVNCGAKNWYTPALALHKQCILLASSLVQSRPHMASCLRSLRRSYRLKLTEAKQVAAAEYVARSPNPCKATWDLIKQSGSHATDPVDVSASAEEFNNYFIDSVDLIVNNIDCNASNFDCLSTVPAVPHKFIWKAISISDVVDIVNNLKMSKSRDMYDMSAILLKHIVHLIAPILTILFNGCLSEGIFPKVLKLSRTIPVYKKGPPNYVSSYRPISLTPIFGKVFEGIMLKQLCDYFEEHCLLAPAQFGFRSGRSTVSAVDSLLQQILAAFEAKQSTAVLLCDLSRAFDCLPHDTLISKFKKYGLVDSALKLVQSYLNGRQQVVSLKGVNSTPLVVKYGVPQGSILGPFLFIVCMNDLYYKLNSKLVFYADDTTLFASHSDPMLAEAFVYNSLLLASDWFLSNKLSLNNDKTQSILFSLKSISNDSKMSPVKLLGFTLDSILSWSDHVDHLTVKLSRVLFLLRRLKRDMPDTFVKFAFFAFFQSHIIYGTRLWGHSSKVRNVLLAQKKAVRILSNAHYLEHCKPLFVNIGVMTVVNVYIFQCILAIKDNESSYATNSMVHRHETRNSSNIHITRSRLSMVLNCFPVSGVRFFNHLPLVVRQLSKPKLASVLRAFLLENPFYEVSEFMDTDLSNLLI